MIHFKISEQGRWSPLRKKEVKEIMPMKLTKTVVLLALSVAAADFAVAGGASRMYVQRGLVAQYDGIDNAGTGTHDSSATTWKNLTGDA